MIYAHHRIECAPRCWASVAEALRTTAWLDAGGTVYGIWRSQIGTPRDELNAITVWPDAPRAARLTERLHEVENVRAASSALMVPTLRPQTPTPPTRQGNFAFRWFDVSAANFDEFLQLCTQAWPGFESSYDSQIIGLWRCEEPVHEGMHRVLLLTRRPDLAMWERSKIPASPEEMKVREALSRRYDLCDATWVYTTTLLTAEDRADEVRWT